MHTFTTFDHPKLGDIIIQKQAEIPLLRNEEKGKGPFSGMSKNKQFQTYIPRVPFNLSPPFIPIIRLLHEVHTIYKPKY